ncbi:restriction endonuclease subunit S [Photobacterium damselae subsp. damselae]|uniref:Restriction endonuclease subunit S n=1 Tax=Photobacterium damselae subsp. damselae TaxID=85581 RepID=A0A850R4R9_PHODD|nr:restriction endonuclease subunit S [Photobacterium damselae subsp. damselae]
MMPSGWEQIRLNDVTEFITSGSRDWAQFYSDSGSKFVRMTNLSRDSIYLKLDDMKYVDVSSKSADGKRTSLSAGDVLMSITAELGKIGWIPENFGEAYINQHTALIRLNNKRANSQYIAYLLSSKAMNHHINKLNDSGAKAGLNLPTIRSIHINLPPLPEQRKIAKILSIWDRGIATTEKLIDASKQQKKALMQQLLTGKKRLLDPETGKAFEGDWKLTTVDEMCNVGRGRVISKKEISENSGIYPVYSSQTLNNGVMGQIGTFDFEGEYATWTTDGVNAGTVFYRTGKFNCTNVCGTLQPKNKAELSTQFLALALSLEAFKYVSHTLANPKLMNNVMKTVSFKIPQFSEQQKIASVLTAADKEIELLEAKLAHFKQEKKALMQQLLTGKRRVNIAETKVTTEEILEAEVA